MSVFFFSGWLLPLLRLCGIIVRIFRRVRNSQWDRGEYMMDGGLSRLSRRKRENERVCARKRERDRERNKERGGRRNATMSQTPPATPTPFLVLVLSRRCASSPIAATKSNVSLYEYTPVFRLIGDISSTTALDANLATFPSAKLRPRKPSLNWEKSIFGICDYNCTI